MNIYGVSTIHVSLHLKYIILFYSLLSLLRQGNQISERLGELPYVTWLKHQKTEARTSKPTFLLIVKYWPQRIFASWECEIGNNAVMGLNRHHVLIVTFVLSKIKKKWMNLLMGGFLQKKFKYWRNVKSVKSYSVLNVGLKKFIS